MTSGTETVAGEYHRPSVRVDLVAVERVLDAALRRRIDELGGTGLVDDTEAMDLMKAIDTVRDLKDRIQRCAAAGD